ncbi:hypothetical protein FGB62_7g651 [Gracilaria domingensis]|nr:hypothetical protein FGB62_7g651 [Gracilaria domingensis]
MKRRRGETPPRSSDKPCPYEGCTKIFRTDRSLSRHLSTHQAAAPIRCSEPTCTHRVATHSELLHHLYESHKQKRERRRNGAVLVSNYSSDETQTEKIPLTSSPQEGVSSELAEEAQEIVDNAQYLSEQMQVARSYEIAAWNGDDYRNAHQWAVWVQENVEDFSNPQYLKHTLNARGLPMNRLLNAERAFLDSVLGFEGVNADILSHLLASAVSKKDEVEERLRCLRDALADAVERKNLLMCLDDIARQFGGNRDSIAVEAKAQALLRVHERTEDFSNLDIQERGVAELLCWEALFACKRSSKVRPSLMELVKSCIAIGHYGDIPVMNELCEWDVSTFDSYLSSLLQNLRRLKRQALRGSTVSGEETERAEDELNSVELRKRIQSLVDMSGCVRFLIFISGYYALQE